MYISLYVDVNTFIGGHQPQNKLMRLRTFKVKNSPLGDKVAVVESLVAASLCAVAISLSLWRPPR